VKQGQAKRNNARAIKALQANNWTGNIRELRNVVERLVIMSDSTIDQKEVKKYL
jgi:two-component system, NtrC family, nitrogen regulation response regulator NtrX